MQASRGLRFAVHNSRVLQLSTSAVTNGRMNSIKREDDKLIHERMRRIFNDPFQADINKGRLECYLSGFPFSDFARTGKVGAWSILKMLETNRRLEFFDYDKDGSKVDVQKEPLTAVLISQSLDVHPELYEKAAIVRPMKVLQRPRHVGRSSMSMYTELIDSETEVTFALNQRQFVCIDPVTRKTVPLTNELTKYKAIADPSAKPLIIPNWPSPSDVFTYSFNTLHTDCDHLYHTNQAVYVRLCANAATLACNEGKLENFDGDFLRYDVSNVLIRYLGESFPGDVLDITLWEDQHQSNTLYFQISKSSQLILTAKFTYHTLCPSDS